MSGRCFRGAVLAVWLCRHAVDMIGFCMRFRNGPHHVDAVHSGKR